MVDQQDGSADQSIIASGGTGKRSTTLLPKQDDIETPWIIRRSPAIGISAVTLIIGVVMLVISAYDNSARPWLASLLINMGTAILLVGPLLFFAGIFQKQFIRAHRRTAAQVADLSADLNEVRQEVADVLEKLSSDTVRRLNDERANDRAIINEVKSDPSAAGIAKALRLARDRHLTASRGPRVSIFDTFLYARWEGVGHLPTDSATIRVTVEGQDGGEVGSCIWTAEETPQDISVEIGHILQSNNCYPGDIAYDPGCMFEELYRLLDLAYKRATGEGGISAPLAPIIQLVGEQWIITERYICSTRMFLPYEIHLNRLDEMDWDSHMGGKGWVDIAEFRLAFDTARALLASGAIVAPPRTDFIDFDPDGTF